MWVQSNRSTAGDIVVVHDFWRDHRVRKAGALRKRDPTLAPVQTAHGVGEKPCAAKFRRKMSEWTASGAIRYREDVWQNPDPAG